jgi:hypothetical protein
MAPRLACLLAVAAMLTATSVALAFTAKLDVQAEGRGMTGVLNCAPGGAVTGEVALMLPTTTQTGPQLAAGGRAAGRYQLTVRVNAAFAGPASEAIAGTAELTGTFTDGGGAAANLRGAGEVTGTGSEGLGAVTIELKWGQMTCEGAGLASPQPLTLRLPPFAVEQQAPPPPSVGNTGGTAPQGGTAPTAPGPGAPNTPGAPLPDPGTGQQTTLGGPPNLPGGAVMPPTLPPTVATPTPPAPPGPPVPEGTPSARDGKLETPMLTAVVGSRRTTDNRGVEATATIAAGSATVYLYVRTHQTPPQAQLLMTLYHDAKTRRRTLVEARAGDEFVVTFYPTDAETFPRGQWSVVVKAGEQVLGVIPFTVGP